MPVLNVEHVAWNVAEPTAMAAWYVEHLGMRIVRRLATIEGDQMRGTITSGERRGQLVVTRRKE